MYISQFTRDKWISCQHIWKYPTFDFDWQTFPNKNDVATGISLIIYLSYNLDKKKKQRSGIGNGEARFFFYCNCCSHSTLPFSISPTFSFLLPQNCVFHLPPEPHRTALTALLQKQTPSPRSIIQQTGSTLGQRRRIGARIGRRRRFVFGRWWWRRRLVVFVAQRQARQEHGHARRLRGRGARLWLRSRPPKRFVFRLRVCLFGILVWGMLGYSLYRPPPFSFIRKNIQFFPLNYK